MCKRDVDLSTIEHELDLRQVGVFFQSYPGYATGVNRFNTS